jgi:hypothetical protein
MRAAARQEDARVTLHPCGILTPRPAIPMELGEENHAGRSLRRRCLGGSLRSDALRMMDQICFQRACGQVMNAKISGPALESIAVASGNRSTSWSTA